MPRFYIPLESFSVNCHYWRNVLRGSGKGRRIKEFIYATTHLSIKQDEKLVSQSWKEKNSSLIVFDNLTLVKKQFLFPEYYISYINSRCTHQLTVRCTPFHNAFKKYKHQICPACISTTFDRCCPRRNENRNCTRSRQQEKGDKSAILQCTNPQKLYFQLGRKIRSEKH